MVMLCKNIGRLYTALHPKPGKKREKGGVSVRTEKEPRQRPGGCQKDLQEIVRIAGGEAGK